MRIKYILYIYNLIRNEHELHAVAFIQQKFLDLYQSIFRPTVDSGLHHFVLNAIEFTCWRFPFLLNRITCGELE